MMHAHYELQEDYTIRIRWDQILDLQNMLYQAGRKSGIQLIRHIRSSKSPAGRKADRNKKER